MTLSEILEQLEDTAPGYRHDALDAAITQREAITPVLLARLEEAATEPQRFAESDSPLLLYSLSLLSHFAEAAAHEPLLAISRLPEPLCEALLGDAISEILPVALWRTAQGHYQGIQSLLADEQAYDFVRWGAARVLAYAAARGELDREEVLAHLDAALSDDPADELTNGGIADAMLGLQPGDYAAHLRELYEKGCIDPWSLVDDDIDKALERSVEESFAETREEFERSIPDNIHGYLSGWAGFAEPSDEHFDSRDDDFILPLGGIPRNDPFNTLPGAHLGVVPKEKTQKARKQNKTARKARKKNRAKKKKR